MNSKRNIQALLLIAFLLTGLSAWSQQVQIKGTVLDKMNQPVEMGNILILSPDSSLLTGSYFIGGQIDFQTSLAGAAFIKLTAIGFADFYYEVKSNPKTTEINLGAVVMEDNLILDGVTVVASRPLFQQDANGMTINVESTLLASTSSVTELLSKTPNVSLNDGVVNVLGRGTALIYLNNQQISKEQMNALSVAQIKEIKLIMNPSARFESEGRAVIQIITKQNELEGIKGSIKHTSTLGAYYFANNHIGLDFRKGKWSFNAGYELQAGKELEKELFDFEIEEENIRSSYDSKYINKTFPGHVYTFGTNYYFTPTSYLSLQFNGNAVAREPVIYASTVVEQGQENQLIQTENEEDLSSSLNAVNLNFNKSFLKAKSNLFIGTQYSSYAYRQQNEIKDSIEPTDALRLSRVNGLSNIDIYAVRADFEKSIGASTKIEIGAKNSLTKANGDIATRAGAGTQSRLELVPSLTNSFDYEESILAFYTQLSGQVKGITYGAGLRG